MTQEAIQSTRHVLAITNITFYSPHYYITTFHHIFTLHYIITFLLLHFSIFITSITFTLYGVQINYSGRNTDPDSKTIYYTFTGFNLTDQEICLQTFPDIEIDTSNRNIIADPYHRVCYEDVISILHINRRIVLLFKTPMEEGRISRLILMDVVVDNSKRNRVADPYHSV